MEKNVVMSIRNSHPVHTVIAKVDIRRS